MHRAIKISCQGYMSITCRSKCIETAFYRKIVIVTFKGFIFLETINVRLQPIYNHIVLGMTERHAQIRDCHVVVIHQTVAGKRKSRTVVAVSRDRISCVLDGLNFDIFDGHGVWN